MADDSSVIVNLQLAAEQFERALESAQESFRKSTAGMGDDARDAGEDVDRAFASLGVRSIEAIRYEIATLQQAFNTLKTSGRASAEDIARAEAALMQKVQGLNAEINKTRGVSAAAGESLESAFGKVGVRSADAIEREIRSIEVALQRLGLNSKVSGADFDRAFAAGQTRIRALEAELRGTVATTDRATAASQRYSSSVGGVVRNLLAWASAAIGLNRAFSFGSDVLQTGAAFEVLEKRLTGLLGSSARAKEEMQNIKDLAASTPFEVMELSDAYTRLTSFGMKPTMETMRNLTDTVSALGGGSESLQRVTIALGQAWVKGKLQGEEIMQLTEAGVPVWEALARATGKSAAELNKMSSAGQLGRDVISKLVVELGKMNVGASALQMNTFSGAVSNAKDALTDFMARIADAGVLDYAKRQIQALLAEFDRMKNSGELEQKAKAIANAFIGLADAAKSVGRFIYDYAGAIKFAIEMMVVKKLLDFTQGLYAQAAASVRAAIEARALAVAAKEAGAASASAGAAAAASAGGYAAMGAGARAAALAMTALRVAMRFVGIGLLVEGLSLAVSWFSRAKAGSDALARSQEDLDAKARSAADALRALAEAEDLLKNKNRQAISYASDRVKQLTEAKTAAGELGIEISKFGNVASESFNKALNQLAAMIRGMPQLKASGIDAAGAVTAAIEKMTESAKNQTELDTLRRRIEVLGKAGDISGEQMKEGLDRVAKKAGELEKGINSVAEAYKQLGMKSPEELRKAATEAEKAFQLISKSGAASVADLREAFKRYAEAAIAANGGVASDALRGQAAMRGLKIETDEAGRAIVRLDSGPLDKVASGADRAAGSLRKAREESDGLNASLERKPQPQRQGGGLSGSGPQPDGLTLEQMQNAGWSSREIEDYQLNRGPNQTPGEVKRYTNTQNIDHGYLARQAGLRGEDVERFKEIIGPMLEDSMADFRSRFSETSVMTATGYRDEFANHFNSAIKEAADKVRSGAGKAPVSEETKSTVHKVELTLPNGQKAEVAVANEDAAKAFIKQLERARGAAA